MKPIKPIAWRRRALQAALVARFAVWQAHRSFIVAGSPATSTAPVIRPGAGL